MNISLNLLIEYDRHKDTNKKDGLELEEQLKDWQLYVHGSEFCQMGHLNVIIM